jgi:hypothetical protein
LDSAEIAFVLDSAETGGRSALVGERSASGDEKVSVSAVEKDHVSEPDSDADVSLALDASEEEDSAEVSLAYTEASAVEVDSSSPATVVAGPTAFVLVAAEEKVSVSADEKVQVSNADVSLALDAREEEDSAEVSLAYKGASAVEEDSSTSSCESPAGLGVVWIAGDEEPWYAFILSV